MAKEGHSTHYYACEPIEESPISGSVLYTSRAFAPLEFRFSQALESLQVAQKLMASTSTLQYPVPAENRVKWEKGWEISKTIGPRGLIIIALTTWVAP